MAAFSAVVSLEQLLKQLSNSNQLPKEELASLHGKIYSLKSSLEKIFPAPKKERVQANKLAIKIREKVFQVQDIVESFISAQSHPSESPETSKIQSWASISSEKIIADLDPITEEAKKLGDSIEAVKKDSQTVVESPAFKSSESDKIMIVGQEKYKEDITEKLLSVVSKREVIPICGMPGIGKTTLAKSIYEDAVLKKEYSHRAWVTVSQDATVEDILSKLLKTLETSTHKAGGREYQGPEEKLKEYLHQALFNNKYLVVIDDMWNRDILKKVLLALPDNANKSRILLTTRMSDVAKSVNKDYSLEMEPLNEDDSWTLLRIKTFGDDKKFVLPELERRGKRIAKNCKGLPLFLTVIGGILSQGSKGTYFWESIEDDTHAATDNVELKDSYTRVLSLSYDYLPSKLKGCFLYMGAFPEDTDIPVSKLIRLWVAEGLLTEAKPAPPQPQLVEDAAEISLRDLIDRNLVLIRTRRSNGRIKACGMHDCLMDFAEKESGKDMFFHLIKKATQKLEGDTNSQRRVSFHKNILMCLDDVYEATKTIKKARTLLYVGSHHPHPMPFNLTFDLLRVLDAFTVFFIEFPDEILELVHLRYLSFTYNGMLPSELSNLHKLQVLIVKREPIIIYVRDPFLPDEIWGMKELRHLLISETDLPDLVSPKEPGLILFENLQTLLNVNAASCTKEVLGHMPNLKRLGMWAEEPGQVEFHLNKLDKLEIFKFTVLNPVPGIKIECQPKLFFPETVRKLCLSGTGLPWEDMEVIAALPNLEVLKLKELAFNGEEWSPTYDFKKLKFLLMEYLNLKWWEAEPSDFPCLEQLIIRHCYDLEAIPSDIEQLGCIKLIELVDCNPAAVEYAKKIKNEQLENGNKRLQVDTYSSWE